YYLIEYWWKVLLFPRGAMWARVANSHPARFDRLAVPATCLVQCLALVAWQRFVARRFSLPESSVPVLLGAGVLLPFLMMSWLSGLVGFLHHTHPRVRWYASVAEWCRFRGQVEGTVHNVIPWPLGWLTGNSLEHTAHHVDPKVPFTTLPASQRRLEETCPEVVVQRLTLRECLRILAACKLYDYRGHRWLGYDGKATAEVSAR